MIFPGLALTTSCKEAAFTFSTTWLLEMLVMGRPNHSGPFATFLNACKGSSCLLETYYSVLELLEVTLQPGHCIDAYTRPEHLTTPDTSASCKAASIADRL